MYVSPWRNCHLQIEITKKKKKQWMAQPLLPPFDHLEASVEFEQKLQSGMKSTLLVWFLFLMNSPWASLCLLCLSRQPLSWGLSRPTHPRFRARECITHVTRFFGFLNGQGDVGLVGVSGVGPCPNPSSWNPYPPDHTHMILSASHESQIPIDRHILGRNSEQCFAHPPWLQRWFAQWFNILFELN